MPAHNPRAPVKFANLTRFARAREARHMFATVKIRKAASAGVRRRQRSTAANADTITTLTSREPIGHSQCVSA